MKHLGGKFFLLVAGKGLSTLGNNFFTLALIWYVLQETHNRSAVALVAALLALPSVIGLFSGTIVDRVNRWGVMICTDVLRFIIAGSIAIIGWDGGMSIGLLVVLTLLLQSIGAFFGPAEMAIIPLLISNEDDLPNANGLNQAVTMLTKLVGLASGGILLSLWSPFTLMFLNSISFGLSGISIFVIYLWGSFERIRLKFPSFSLPKGKSSIVGDWKKGMETVLHQRTLRMLIPIAVIINFSLAPLMSLDAVWVDQNLEMPASAYGFVEASLICGVILGSLVVGIIRRIIPFHRIIPFF